MTVLVGYTPSEASEAALAKAIELARNSGEHLVVMNAGPGGENRTDSSMTTAQKEGLQARLAQTGLSSEFREYARGRSTVDEFKEAVAELTPSVVVIGMKPRSGFRRFVMGSVADELLRTLNEPILCVKAVDPQDPTARDHEQETTTFEG